MEYRLGDDLPVGIYRSNDNVKYLSVKVSLKKVTPSCLSNNDLFSQQDKSGDLELLPTGEYSAFSVECTFAWQEKICSENSTVDDNKDKTDVLTRQKHQAILFSYLDSEMSLEEWQRRRPVTCPPSYSYLEKKSTVRYRGKSFNPQTRALQKVPFSERKPIIHMPSKQTASYQLQSVGQFMSIMVAFHSFDSADKEERELCFLHMDPDGCLTVFPDFSVNGVPYVIQNHKSETFEYFIECASKDIQMLEAETEKKIVQKLNHQHAEALSPLVGMMFDRPSSNLKFFLNGEIASSCGFLCDNLYIQYYFEFPEGWNLVNEESLSGSTYTCCSKQTVEGKVAHFGFPVCLEVEIDLEKSVQKDCGLPAVLFFAEIISLDRWGNGRGEGYGYATIPLCPGSYSINITTWKVLPVSLIQRLRHFFIGGTSYLEDISCVRIPNSTKDPQLSKYGIKTESSGSVNLKYHIVFQTGSEISEEKCDFYLQPLSRKHKDVLS